VLFCEDKSSYLMLQLCTYQPT